MHRTINSPGVQIFETDKTQYVEPTVGTNILVMGFASQGPIEELINVTTVSEFEEIFGVPSNAAERYFYHSIKQTISSSGNTIVARLPYGNDGYSTDYSAILYPVEPLDGSSGLTSFSDEDVDGFEVGTPIHLKLTVEEYEDLNSGNFEWSHIYSDLSSTTQLSGGTGAGIIIVNESKTAVNDFFEGYYLNLTDNSNINPATNYTSIDSIYSIDGDNDYNLIAPSRLSFELTSIADSNIPSISETVESLPGFDIGNSGYDDVLILPIFKIRPDFHTVGNVGLINILTEGYVGSLQYGRKIVDPNTGDEKSLFLEDVVNESNSRVKLYVNPFISKKSNWYDSTGAVNKVRTTDKSLYSTGIFTSSSDSANKKVNGIPDKVARIMAQANNPSTQELDIVVEAGLGTIFATKKLDNTFDETYVPDLSDYTSTIDGSIISNPVQTNYLAVANALLSETEGNGRRDFVVILDPIRQLLVQGNNRKVVDDKNSNFSTDIYWAMRNQIQGFNTSYGIFYGNWAKTYDGPSDRQCWIPFSGVAAKAIANSDADANYWAAPAGVNRGVISGITDLAINPNQRQRDLLYKVNINPVVLFPDSGFNIWGQKTLYKNSSAFNRINVRRLFIYLEKTTQRYLKNVVFEPNNIFTRTSLINTLDPFFTTVKNDGGMYDYLIICDERNNTADVIDRNELRIAFYIKPTRTSEYILANFIGTGTGTDFNEII